jgi:hypothetical protein
MFPEAGLSPSVVYSCPRASSAAQAPRTSRFVNAVSGGVAFLHTDAALAWDDEHLHVDLWLEERDVWTTGEPRGGLTWQENTVEVLLAADGALYNLSVNAAGVTQQLLFIWHDAYQRGGRYDVADLDLATQSPMVVGGDSAPHHRRGRRWLFDNWQLQGLQVETVIDGKLNERHEIDRGWRVRLALPWAGLQHVLDCDGSPSAGCQLRLALARNQVMEHNGVRQAGVWSWHTVGAQGLYAPESYPVVALAGG